MTMSITGKQKLNAFLFYPQLFPGNTDKNTIIRNALSPAIRAQFIRIYPKEFRDHRAMRLEFIGYYKDQKPGPLGLEDRRIQDGQLSASTENQANHGPHDGRLHNERTWVASAGDQWLQVDFLRLVKVTEIWTQGRTDSDPDEWIKSYNVEYSLNAVDFTAFTSYVWTTTANKDGYSVVRKAVLPPFEARAIRITVTNFQIRISLRMEVIGYYITCAATCYARPLGMESGEISDTQITASSSAGWKLPGGARLNFQNQNVERHSWAALETDRLAWLQVAFYQTVNIIEVQTQARFSTQLFYNYTLSYGNNGVDFESYEEDDMMKIFHGNDDQTKIVSHYLWPVITARFIRINALSCGVSCALRVEFIGTYEVIHGPELIDPEFVEFENTLTASSSRDWNHQPHHGIISNHFHPRAWSPVKEERLQYIQVDLLQLTVISGIGFRLAGDRIHDHYTKLVLWYGDTEESLKFLRDHNGNMTLFDTRECYTALEKRLLTRHVRFEVDSWETRPDFRFQLYGTTVYSEATADVESGSIKDDQMKSSNHPNDPYPAHEGRLNGPSAWCGNPLRNKLYLQIDFLWNFEVHGVATQGKPVGIMEYTTEYKLSSTMDGISWDLYKEDQTVKMFTGNTSCRCTRKNPVQPFLARALRFLPTAWKDAPCMRVEVFGIYKGILRIHARSGVLKGANETVVTRKCSIKLNGQEVSRKMPGYNVVVANPKTGALISSGSAENPSDVNDLLMNVTDDSIVVVATQNVTQRPSNETLHLLESLGAISLRYSLTSEDLVFLLVGYKGDERVNWIKEKLGTSKDGIVRVAVPIKLNENEMKPAVNQHFVNSNNTEETEITLSGDNAYIFHNITGKCGENDTDCEMGLSLSMWMKQEPLDYVENIESAPTPGINGGNVEKKIFSISGRIDLQYYSRGYNYIVIKDAKVWKNAHRYVILAGPD
ncbi:Hypothetical predicted protein [Paramuricea clavata]|uniref:Uncharacterized protein n=1 Tax=Paramuricea clavata TaxID=317549 RepID=A0A6S7JU10_PARCT|nr:Hypothetical predicted protein [Paramuricea clavata]